MNSSLNAVSHTPNSLSADSKGGAPTADLTGSLLFRINRNWNWFISWCCWIRLYETFFEYLFALPQKKGANKD